MNTTDLDKLKTELENNHKANIAAIERLRIKMQKTPAEAATLIQMPQHKERMSHIVERAITNFAGNFTVASITRKYTEMTQKKSSENVRREISNCINKLRHRNPPEIDVIIEGKGSRSGVYKMRKTPRMLLGEI